MSISVMPLTYPLSTAQTEIWLAQQLHPDSPVYNIAQYTVIEGAIDPTVFEAALRQVIGEADSLRLQFVESDDGLRQAIGSPAWSMPVLDLTAEADPQAAVQAWMRADYEQPVDLMQGPLFRYALLKVASKQWVWYQRTHHIIMDGYAFFLIAQRVAQVYSAMCAGREPAPCALGSVLQLLDSDAQYQTSAQRERDEAYWLRHCAHWPEPATLASRAAPALQHRLRQTAYLETQALGKYASDAGQLAQLLTAALAAYLHRMSGAQDVALGLPVTARLGADRHIPGTLAHDIPLRFTVQPEMNLSSLLQQAVQIQRGFRYQRYPSEALRRRLGLPPGQALFGATVNVMPFDYDLSFDGYPSTNHNLLNGPVDDLMLGVYWAPNSSQCRIDFNANPACYTVQALDTHQRRFVRFVQALVADPMQSIGGIDLLDAEERHRLLVEWNATQQDYPANQCIHQLFEAQVERTPQATALVYEDQTLSYAQLNARANRLAHQLIELGVTPDARVALCVERSLAMVVGLLAILKAGGAYVPLDPAYPGERLLHILEDASPQMVLADGVGRAALGEAALADRTVLDPNTVPQQAQTNPSVAELTSRHLAYVIYTSGSTGMPKGVMVEHHNVINFVRAMASSPGITRDDRLLAVTSVAFDIAGLELYLPLSQGATVVIASRDEIVDPNQLQQRIIEHKISLMQATPAVWRSLLNLPKPVLNLTALCGGEGLPVHLSAQLSGVTRRLWNLYGPTETTIWSTVSQVGEYPADQPIELIGRPIANTQIYLLDSYGQPVPLGAAGELYIGGAGVARGYLNRPELTAERFVPDPFAPEPDARMYKTGDLARYLPDGNLTFLGRNDHQVKIRGFRIELGEIEACLAQHAQVREAVVLALGESQDKRLVAYVVAEADESLTNALRMHVSAALPEYMVPSAFVRLEALPLTPNGKLDRRALPAPDDEAFAHQAYEAPQGELECTLAEIWSELLGVEQVGRHDNFFALGGHSLLAVQMIERLRRCGLGMSVRALFDTPVLSALAQSLGQHRDVAVPPNRITRETTMLTPDLLPLIELTQGEIDCIVEQVPGGVANIQDIYALSPLQDGILFHHLLATQGDPYLLIVQLAFDTRARLDQYLEAVQQVVNRHDILRTAFVWEGLSTPAQVVWRQAPLSVTELTLDAADGPIAEQLARCFDPRHTRLNLTQAPLLRCAMAQDTDGRWMMVQLSHHLVSDHSTLEVMHTEVRAFIEGKGETLPAAQPFRNLVAQARLGVSQIEHERFFTEQLADIEEPTLPFGLSEVHRDGAQVNEAHRMLPQALNDRLRAHAKRLNVSLASLCHLAWAQVLARASGQQRVVFGTVLFGRMQAGGGADSAMGLFINTLPLRVDLEGSVESAVRAAHARLAALLEHEHASLALAQRCSGVPAGTPLFSALLNYRHNAPGLSKRNTLSGIELLSAEERTNYPLTLSVEDFGQALGVTAQAVTSLDPGRVCGYMQQALQSLAEALETAPEWPVERLEVLPIEERELLLETWNATAQDYPAHQCIHHLFEAQVERTPQAPALVYEDQTLSYAQLNAQANRLAHQLIELGVKPDARVAICVERSPAMVVGLLAILKAGGAYVPLDPVYPSERLVHILQDAAPEIVLADAVGCAVLGDEALEACAVLDPNTPLERADTNPLVPDLALRHLAYVIYTSGSTGMPKGVMVVHKGVSNYLNWAMQAYVPNDGAVVSSSFSFDATVTSLWTPLLYGSTVHLLSAGNEIEALEAYVSQAQGKGLVKITPAHLDMLGQRILTEGIKTRVAVFVIGGEALNASTVAMWQRIQPDVRLINEYGPTETVVGCAVYEASVSLAPSGSVPIGRPIANTRIYLLDAHGQPVPLGAVGELYIGGAGVARGYLNRPELTAERFVRDPFSDESNARMYKTGDLARYLPDGNLAFLGRNDHQVKIRGFRIEPGEIEACLAQHAQVREAVVLALGDGPDKRLVAYVVAEPDDALAGALRAHVVAALPEYMVPSAFVRLEALPLTPNGKLDRRALPAPDAKAFAHQAYEAPQGELECTLAAIWSELLGVEQVGRHDNFFALGGHSLLAVQMIERLRRCGLGMSVRALFDTPVLSALTQSLGQHRDVAVPPNRITRETTMLTPDLLPLIELTQGEIDCIVEQVPGGVANVQDIYALSPLQDGILFHHLLATQGDPYLLIVQLAFDTRARLDQYLEAVQQVVNRHDILRTAFVWEGLSTPAQVVWRQASLSVTELTLDAADGPIAEQLARRFDPCHTRLDLTQAPLLRCAMAQDTDGRWMMVQLLHHLVNDHSTLEVMHTEIRAFIEGKGETLPAAQPFRNLVAQARLGVSQIEHERFFTEQLADIEEPTLPFGLSEVHRDGAQVNEAHRMLPQALNDRLRDQAKRLNVSLASLCHLAWAQVLARASGQQRVVFGTVLFGRMQAGGGADSAMGLFINTLPLRVDLEGSVESAVRATHARLAALLEHEHASLALAQRCSGVPAGTPLFSALLNYRHNAINIGERGRLPGVELLHAEERDNYPIGLSIEDFGQALGLTAQIVKPLDPDRVCGYMQQALQSLAEALETTPEWPVEQLEVLPGEERELLLNTWNATQQHYPAHQCLHQLFEAQAERTPQAPALVYEDQMLSYAQLNARANRLAHQLIELGVQPDARVAVYAQRSPEMIVGILATLKAGGAYVPLDPAYPPERLAYMVSDSTPAVLLSVGTPHAAVTQSLGAGVPVLDLHADAARWAYQSTTNLDASELTLTAQNLAYVIYTSGSTGCPKGVMVQHQGVINLVTAIARELDITAQDRMLQFAPLSFDTSVEEIFTPLTRGAALVLRTDAWLAGAEPFWALCDAYHVSVVDLPVQFWSQLVQEAASVASSVRAILIGGDALSASARDAWFAGDGHRPRLLNVYGPTETTVTATVYEVTDNERSWRTIGRPIDNTRLYILDPQGHLLPLGAVGELYIGGAGVARGYLNRPELTAERFVCDPFSDEPNARMYKTGDLAHYLPDGNLEFLGRNDHQVKLRGFRIELGEIEACLAQHAQVRDAVVLATGEGQDKRLVAYVVAESDEQLANTLRAHVAAALPEYMVPSAFVRLEALPLTPNGKLDRRALPAPDADAFAQQMYEAPQGELETTLARLWSELLGVEQVSRHDSFFALGGHSLLAVQMIERLRRCGLGMSVRALFDTPVLSALAQSLGQHRDVTVPPNRITRETSALTPDLLPLIELTQGEIDCIVEQVPGGVANIQDIYALSPLQDGILFHHLLATQGDPYLLIAQLTFDTRARLDQYLEAVQQVVNRHDILRTAFVWEGLSMPAQVVWRQAPLSVTELTLDAADGPIAEQLARCFDPRHTRLNLTQAPLLRCAMAQDTDGRWIMVQLLHHLIGDHSTAEVMRTEVQAFIEGRGRTLPSAQPFRNLVAQARLGVSQAEHERFFTEQLADIEEPTLPFGLSEVHRDGAQVNEVHRMLPQALNDRLRDQAKRLNVSLASLCHLAWAQVLARASGQQRVVFGTVLFGRMQAGEGADSAMGLFINTLPLRVDLEGSVESAVRATHARLAALLEHEHASLALAQRCSGVPAGTPLFSALLNYRHNARDSSERSLLSGVELLSAQERTNYPLTLSVEDFGQALGVTAQAVTSLDPERVCGYMQQTLQSLAEALEATPEWPVRQLEVLPIKERTLLLETWNATQQDYPANQCLHQLFEAQAAHTPQAPALVYEDQMLSYAQLNAQANRLAHQLIELGVKPDVRVAICVQRSLAMVVGLLAILKAGGGYVPLDPVYPGERLAHILRDAAPDIVLADAAGRAALGEVALAHCTVLDPNTVPQQADTNPSVPGLTARHLAYVIYTSGSTGMPKGVMVEHAQVVRLFDATQSWYHFDEKDTWCLFHSFAFDFSVWELWGALRYGGKLIIVPHHIARSPQDFYRLVCEQGVTVLNQTPSAFKTFIASQAQSALRDQLHYVIFGGEALELSILQAWYATRAEQSPQLVNMYGITEATVHVTYRPLRPEDSNRVGSPIGVRIPDLKIYLLDDYGQPVPLGAVGELYIGGAGVARGYLNRPELTAERFVRDPFAPEPDARMYKTGDLARYLPDGNLAFLGRNDHQVKIRGFRIELGEIEACLAQHAQVREAVVLALGDGSDKRLVAYVVAEPDDALAGDLRAHVAAALPEYMVPSAFVRLEALPLTPNGKLDRRALPAPDDEAFAHQAYEAPRGELECTLAAIWSELLGVERISRHDSFFALGGHSLLAVQMIERLRRCGLGMSVRALFDTPVLSALAQSLGQHRDVAVPPNRITRETSALTPDLLLLIELTQGEIDRIVEQVPGGVANIQDIYALSPLQDGILFHHLLATQGDPYLLIAQLTFDTRARLDQYLEAVQQVVNRHDILRTAFVWEGLSTPAQVVWRQAPLSVTELTLDAAEGPIAEQLARRFDPRHTRLDLTQAPLLRCAMAQDTDGRWIMVQLLHHLIGDHSTAEVMRTEVQAFIEGRGRTLSSAQPFRNLVAQARLGVSQAEHERFFTEQLADIEEPTLPFGLSEVHRDGAQVNEAHRMLPQALNDRLRDQAKRLNVSLASLCHLAWAQVLARASGQQRVVFGTVLFGRMQAGGGADSAMGLFINTLPLRVDLEGSVQACVRATHARLAALLEHEHASLALAQRCSGVPAGTPLFSALLNYRHNARDSSERSLLSGVELLSAQERTNYPLTLSVEDFGQALGVTAQAVTSLDPERVCGYMQQTLQSLAEALEATPEWPVRQLEVLPIKERTLLLETWNATQQDYPANQCLHQLFEAQAAHTPQAPALVYEDQMLSYAQLNAQANRLAHQLIELGVKPDARVAICVQRSLAMVVGLLAILKAGGAYVPLDPVYPGERLAHILQDAAPDIVLADAAGRVALGEAALAHCTVLDPNTVPQQADTNPSVPGLTARHLAYVIYTSGSTGMPKGVMVEHQSLVNLYTVLQEAVLARYPAHARVGLNASIAFDASLQSVLSLLNGNTLVVLPQSVRFDGATMLEFIEASGINVLDCTPLQLEMLLSTESFKRFHPLTLLVGGESIALPTWQTLAEASQLTVCNVYGPTECTVDATLEVLSPAQAQPTIGRPIANARIYLLDGYGQLVPLGAVGELYIGGAGVARGYLNRPELTAERFVCDPFATEPDARMYKTGDLARYLPDGNLAFLGRNDHQVKIRGFRIEPGEIEACLTQHAQVREAVVLTLGDGHAKRLVAYVVAEADEQLANTLRAHVAAALPEYMVPSAFVRLEALPLTPNGKLDRRALPAPDDEAFAHQAYEAPQGELEATLAQIWSELLGVERISRHDSFFVLGGHSLLAVQMISRSRTALGISIAMHTLFEAPTVAALAQRVSAQGNVQDESFAVVLPIQPHGARPALFCVHPITGLSWHYRGLASHLEADQPVYGLQARGLDGDSLPALKIEAMAKDYIQQIRRIQPKGPYYLLGWSFGGKVVHSMAVQLEQQGERVALLAVLDTTPNHLQRDDEPEAIEKADFYISLFARHDAENLSEAGQYLWEKTRAVIQNNQRIVTSFSPRIYSGDMLFFRASVAQDASTELISPQAWQPYVLGNVEVYDIACKHEDMELPEPTAYIGRILRQKLNELQKCRSSCDDDEASFMSSGRLRRRAAAASGEGA
ncbi:amino acid adenylation domain-containing protein [Mycetohabitans rhizoxinica]|uniref:non-ribosomal peptide synthetase n=1 Tax=Mycetohabitans rhizoxinica TaxID=412963 RepID=UPI0030CFA7BA